MSRPLWAISLLTCAIVLGPLASPLLAQCLLFQSSSRPDAAALQPAIDSVRQLIGGNNNGNGGSFTSGRREVNWDDVQDFAATPNALSNIHYLASRGLMLHSSTRAGAFQVSADEDNPTNTPVRFGNINASYPSSFQTFSGERLLGAFNTTVVEIQFFVPNTRKPATVRKFAAVLVDVDVSTVVRFYSIDGLRLGDVTVEPHNNGLSYIYAEPFGSECFAFEIGRVEIFAGNAPLASGNADNGTSVDVVAVDDLIYSEPRPAAAPGGSDFDGDGLPDIAMYRPSNGGWFIVHSGSNAVDIKFWGEPGDIPVPADYDGDGRVDIAVFRPSESRWWFLQSPPLTPRSQVFGEPGDIPVPFDYNQDGRADLAVWRPSDGGTYILFTDGSNQGIAIYWGQAGDIPLTKQ